jgi:hypothetical protein
MTSFCVCFELRKGTKRHYHDLFAALERFEDRCQFSNGVWFVGTDWTAEQVYAHLPPYMDPEDALSVDELPVNRGWSGWVRQGVREWLERHLGPG